MRGMRSALASVLVTLLIVGGGVYLYMRQMQPKGSGGSPTAAISTVAVQTDILAIAQAERGYFALNNSYASLDELISSGSLKLPRPAPLGYTYSIETSPKDFTVTARYTGRPNDKPGTRFPTYVVDQRMQIRQVD